MTQDNIDVPMATRPAATLRLDNVTVAFGGQDALQNLTLELCEPRVAIVGRNGSGKTTLARIIAGLQIPDTGKVTINGTDIAKDRAAAIGIVGIMFQNPDHQIIFPTVQEEIAFGLLQQGHKRDAAAQMTHDILSRFGKSHWAAAATHTLSQGQKQLVCLMSVLAMQPKMIVMDEPYSGLDIATRLQLVRYVATVTASILQISHDPDTVRHFDRVIWLDEGKIRDDGPAATVLPAFEAQMRLWGGQDDLTHLAS